MTEKPKNTLSRKIVETKVHNQLFDYFPKILCNTGDGRIGFSIGAKLPTEEHKKWISHILGNELFRKKVKKEIENILCRHVFNHQAFLEISWGPGGAAFETTGANGCLVYPESEAYTCHNIDDFEQAAVLFIVFSVYLENLYFALEEFENGTFNPEKFPPLKEGITDRIELNLVPDCQMKYGECIHWKTWICGLCTRNPKKAFTIKDKTELTRIGDKWEPEGGLPGKNICPVCGANISSEKCPFCEE